MLNLNSWVTPDRRNLILLNPDVLATVLRYVQIGSQDSEAGGILLGKVRAGNLEIIEATEPTRKDWRSRFFFVRHQNDHQKIVKQRWEDSQGQVRYLGEWHTHPEDFPSPSGTDLREWRVLAESRIDGRPLLAVIVGRKGLHVEYMHKDGRRVLLSHLLETCLSLV